MLAESRPGLNGRALRQRPLAKRRDADLLALFPGHRAKGARTTLMPSGVSMSVKRAGRSTRPRNVSTAPVADMSATLQAAALLPRSGRCRRGPIHRLDASTLQPFPVYDSFCDSYRVKDF